MAETSAPNARRFAAHIGNRSASIPRNRKLACEERLRRYGVEISPLLVATIQRFPQRTIESTRPAPGRTSPRATLQMPLGPWTTAVPLATSCTIQPGIVVGGVSGTGASLA